MNQGPVPLPIGTLLAGRFEIERVLGRGGFGIAYLANDVVRSDMASIKELAPIGAVRNEAGLIDLDQGGVSSHRLRQSFLEEARLLSRLSVPGILPIRAVFAEHGTAYFATDHLGDAQTLENLLHQEGRMDPAGAMDILFQLIETLEAVHSKKILHRDIKPSNILVSPKGQAYLIDFGSAREWHADESVRHTILYTPGYAPIEQLSERGKRGPATDIYALCATAYRMLTGAIPMPATDRLNGAELTPLRSLRPDLEPALAAAVEAGLQLRYHDRPQSLAEFRALLAEVDEPIEIASLAAYDAKLLKLQRFGFDRRQCPACGGLLEQPKPLRKWACPVCREGVIRTREIASRLCPACQIGTLHKRSNNRPLAFCPLCRIGELALRRKGVISRHRFLDCSVCKASFSVADEGIAVVKPGHVQKLDSLSASLDDPGTPRTSQEWRDISERSAEVWVCDGCEAQYDVLEDGRWGQIHAKPRRYEALYPEEWARVAAGLPPGAGNAACDVCRADYFVDVNRLTLLNSEIDPYGFAEEELGRLLDADDARWLGVGKDSPQPGLVCVDCHTEFDFDGEYLRLVKTLNRALLRQLGEPKTIGDWHRLALELPEVHEEIAFRTDVLTAIRCAYETGEIGLDAKNDTLWRGPGSKDGQNGTLTLTKHEVVFGGLFKKWRLPYDAVMGARATGDQLDLIVSGQSEPESFQLSPIELTVQLTSGSHSVLLNAEALAARIRASRRDPHGRIGEKRGLSRSAGV